MPATYNEEILNDWKSINSEISHTLNIMAAILEFHNKNQPKVELPLSTPSTYEKQLKTTLERFNTKIDCLYRKLMEMSWKAGGEETEQLQNDMQVDNDLQAALNVNSSNNNLNAADSTEEQQLKQQQNLMDDLLEFGGDDILMNF